MHFCIKKLLSLAFGSSACYYSERLFQIDACIRRKVPCQLNDEFLGLYFEENKVTLSLEWIKSDLSDFFLLKCFQECLFQIFIAENGTSFICQVVSLRKHVDITL